MLTYLSLLVVIVMSGLSCIFFICCVSVCLSDLMNGVIKGRFCSNGFITKPFISSCGSSISARLLNLIIKASQGVPRCECGGMIKPDVVLYEEGRDGDVIGRSVRAIAEAQVLIIGGTSLVVYPAAGLIDYFRGDCLVVINKAPTPRDRQADLVISEPIGKVFSQIRV